MRPDIPNPIVHKVEVKPVNEIRKVKTRLDEILEEKENRAAMRYSAAEMEKMALESENEAARLRGEPPKHKTYHGGDNVEENGKRKEDEAKRREQLTTSAIALINSGMEPAQVGQMLMGLPVMQPGMPGLPVAQGMTLKDVQTIVGWITERKEADEIKSLIKDLSDKISVIERGGTAGKKDETKPIDPITFARQQAEAVKAWNEALRELMPKSPPTAERGEPIEVVKERNRHEEKMEEIKGDTKYKNELIKVASEIPERIGAGWAGQFSSEDKGEPNSGLEYIVCSEEDCGARIYAPADADNLTCPKCGAVYSRRPEVTAA